MARPDPLCPCFTEIMARLKRLLRGGSDGNEQLTALVGTLLLIVLAVEGATLLNLRSLLTAHAFVSTCAAARHTSFRVWSSRR